MLRQFIQEASVNNDEEGPTLAREMIDFLVRFYAGDHEGDTGSLKWHYASFGSKGVQDGRNVGAMYVPERLTLVINRQPHNLFKKVIDVLHEIQHYNQHMDWEHGDDATKMAFIKGKKLPKGMDAYDAVRGLSYVKLIRAWLDIYGYDNSPHEIDARRYARDNGKEAMGYIRQHFL